MTPNMRAATTNPGTPRRLHPDPRHPRRSGQSVGDAGCQRAGAQPVHQGHAGRRAAQVAPVDADKGDQEQNDAARCQCGEVSPVHAVEQRLAAAVVVPGGTPWRDPPSLRRAGRCPRRRRTAPSHRRSRPPPSRSSRPGTYRQCEKTVEQRACDEMNGERPDVNAGDAHLEQFRCRDSGRPQHQVAECDKQQHRGGLRDQHVGTADGIADRRTDSPPSWTGRRPAARPAGPRTLSPPLRAGSRK